MSILSLEHSRTAYYADFAVYILAIALGGAYLLAFAPAHAWFGIAIALPAGLAGWTLLEYIVHRFVFHGLQPFQGWHAEHHRRPQALIGTPTVVTGAILVTFIFFPAAQLGDRWLGTGLALGVAAGFLAYGWIHHGTHHGRARTRWMRRLKRLHARHHGSGGACLYGVTTTLWDHLFGSAR